MLFVKNVPSSRSRARSRFEDVAACRECGGKKVKLSARKETFVVRREHLKSSKRSHAGARETGA